MAVTLSDIVAVVEEAFPRSRSINYSIYQRLASLALTELASRTGGFEGEWTSGSGGTITLSGNTATFPFDLIRVDSVIWNDRPLSPKTAVWLDAVDPLWRTLSGEPSYYVLGARSLVLDRAPSGGTLRVWGIGELPPLGGLIDPLTLISDRMALSLAYFIGANLNLDLQGRTDEEKQVLLARQQMWAKLWEQSLVFNSWRVTARRGERLTS